MEKFQQVWLLLKNFCQKISDYILNFLNLLLEFITNLWISILNNIVEFWQWFKIFFGTSYFNLNLFQNVILGILIIFIFIGEQIFAEIKLSRERKEFSKMVILYEILNIPFIFSLAIFFLILFTLKINSPICEFLIVLIFLFLLLKLSLPILKFQNFFRGKRHKLDMSFLKSLNFSKILKFRNKTKSENMIRAWQSVWSSKTIEFEEDFIKIFIIHIDGIIKLKNFYFARQLFETYLNNFQKRTDFFLGDYTIYPKILEWDENFWYEKIKKYNYRQKNTNNIRNKIEKFLSNFKNYFPVSIVMKISNWYERNCVVRDGWLQYDYFRSRCLPVIVKELLKQESFQLFLSFKKHTQKMQNKLTQIPRNTEKRKQYNKYINHIFRQFFFTFFNNINLNQKSFSSHSIGYYFPNEWRITISNIDEKNSSQKNILLRITYTFIKWARSIAFFTKDENQNLTAAVNLLFPNVHPSLFTAFLALLFNFQREIKYAIEKKPNFYFIPPFPEPMISSGNDAEDREERLLESDKRKKEEKEETIQIILKFFNLWGDLSERYKEDFTEDEWNNWKNMQEIDRKRIIRNIKIKKLKEVKIELENLEIKEIPNEEYRQENKKNCLELIELLIENLENKKTV